MPARSGTALGTRSLKVHLAHQPSQLPPRFRPLLAMLMEFDAGRSQG